MEDHKKLTVFISTHLIFLLGWLWGMCTTVVVTLVFGMMKISWTSKILNIYPLLTQRLKKIDSEYSFCVFSHFFGNTALLCIDNISFLLLKKTLCVMGQHAPRITLGRVRCFCLGFARSVCWLGTIPLAKWAGSCICLSWRNEESAPKCLNHWAV